MHVEMNMDSSRSDFETNALLGGILVATTATTTTATTTTTTMTSAQ